MCLIFTCGEHTFRREVEGYEGLVCRCHHCGNHSAGVIKSNPWFTFCFIPVIPLSFKGYQDVTCRICNFQEPLENRPDVQALRGQAGQMPMHPPPGGPHGWGGPPKPNQPMRYG